MEKYFLQMETTERNKYFIAFCEVEIITLDKFKMEIFLGKIEKPMLAGIQNFDIDSLCGYQLGTSKII